MVQTCSPPSIERVVPVTSGMTSLKATMAQVRAREWQTRPERSMQENEQADLFCESISPAMHTH